MYINHCSDPCRFIVLRHGAFERNMCAKRGYEFAHAAKSVGASSRRFHSPTPRPALHITRKGYRTSCAFAFGAKMYHPPPPMASTVDVPSKKRRPQVKLACMNCRRQHAGCTESRPCERCIRLGLAASCEDMPRKKRTRKRVHLGSDDEDDFETLAEITSGMCPFYVC